MTRSVVSETRRRCNVYQYIRESVKVIFPTRIDVSTNCIC